MLIDAGGAARPVATADLASLLAGALDAGPTYGWRNPAPVTKGGLAGWQLRRVRAHVEAHLQGPIFTSTLAEVAQLSTGHFCRAFKASTGETPHGYVMRQRIRRAQQLMRDTTDTLSQIACACGMSDQAHLTRLFRRLVGTTPLAWRRAWQQAG
ncbi:helix-turn-helix domain-containing protein [Sphingomonas elodea]|uniref:helix-turn-helix domain-containing protein n=1 Tax=Sphingomonas elodea TaxID=179878 RepID=UPI00031C8D9B|nr:AraC family transcriptional regulator [Sphingomonas elodea]